MAEPSEEAVGSAFELEYVTSAVPVQTNDNIAVQVVNDSGVAENVRLVIYRNTGTGALTVVDTGRVVVAPTWAWTSSFPVVVPGNYWLRVQATSESLIPQAMFERVEAGIWKPVIYRSGDFAVFSLTRKRLW